MICINDGVHEMKKYKIGYTQGVFDMFHIGHLNLLLNAKKQCEQLIVGVNADELVEEYKHKCPVINENDRRYIVEHIDCVDKAIIVHTLDKEEMWNSLKFDAIFIGSDWKGNSRWEETGKKMKELGAELVYLPHTDGISSTMLRNDKDKMTQD